MNLALTLVVLLGAIFLVSSQTTDEPNYNEMHQPFRPDPNSNVPIQDQIRQHIDAQIQAQINQKMGPQGFKRDALHPEMNQRMNPQFQPPMHMQRQNKPNGPQSTLD